jgi:hypothetical protein
MEYKLTIKWEQGGPYTRSKPHTIFYYKCFEKASKDLKDYKSMDGVKDVILENV